MTEQNKDNLLFLSALKEAVRQYPHYFYITGELNQIDSMWDLQPQFSTLESLLLEDEPTQQFVIAVWSFFKPIALGESNFADMTRKLHPWQRSILSQLMLYDPLNEAPAPEEDVELSTQ
ncbi:MAG: hypothetical protein MI867_07425 [Pseudomonadales bacterium]|nr:hypothetical protein [Pseudomonadales bacterium]